MLNIPDRYAKDPRIAHVGGHHIVLAGGARIYERNDRDGGPYEAVPAHEFGGTRHDTVHAALEALLGDPQKSKLAQALAAEFEPRELDVLRRGIRTEASGAYLRSDQTLFVRLETALTEAMPEVG